MNCQELAGTNDHFRYPPFQDATRQIRLLRFLCSDDSDGLQLQMEVYDLNAVRFKFVAISYTWGDSEDLTLVRVNQQKLAITLNGAEALTRASRYDPGTLHWIE